MQKHKKTALFTVDRGQHHHKRRHSHVIFVALHMLGAPCYSYDDLVFALLSFVCIVLNFLLIASPGYASSNTPPYHCIRHDPSLERLLGVMNIILIAHAQEVLYSDARQDSC